MTSARLVPGDAKIKSWHDGMGMTVWGCGGKPGIFSTGELNSPNRQHPDKRGLYSYNFFDMP
jgi:hypothetical protein